MNHLHTPFALPSRHPALLAALVAFAIVPAALRAQDHSHIYVGALDTDLSGGPSAGDRLAVKNPADNGYDFGAGTGYTAPLTFTSIGAAALHYGGAAWTYTVTPEALPGPGGQAIRTVNAATREVSYRAWESYVPTAKGPLPVAGAAPGAFIAATLSVTRIAGTATSFSFWGPVAAYPSAASPVPAAEWTFDALGIGTAAGTPTFHVTSITGRIGDGTTPLLPGTGPLAAYPDPFTPDQVAAGFRWNVAPLDSLTTAVDPYGHIHGRSWAANGPGEFRLDWLFTDLNGLHLESAIYSQRLVATPEPSAGALAFGAAALALAATGRRPRGRRS